VSDLRLASHAILVTAVGMGGRTVTLCADAGRSKC